MQRDGQHETDLVFFLIFFDQVRDSVTCVVFISSRSGVFIRRVPL